MEIKIRILQYYLYVYDSINTKAVQRIDKNDCYSSSIPHNVVVKLTKKKKTYLKLFSNLLNL